jgi:large repetitive protein
MKRYHHILWVVALLIGNWLILAQSTSGLIVPNIALPIGVVNQVYPSTQLLVSGGTGTGYVFINNGAALPFGMTLTSSGVLQGTPLTSYSNTLTVRVQDSANNTGFGFLQLQVTTFSCPVSYGLIGEFYQSGASFSNFSANAFSITSGSLPTGLTLDPQNGSVIGQPTAIGVFDYTLRATNSNLNRSVSQSCRIEIQNDLQVTPNRTTARFGVPYQSAISATGGIGTYTYSLVSGSLPPGLSLSPPTGWITGTPTALGVSNYRIRVQDSNGLISERDMTMWVLDRGLQPNLRCALPSGTIGYLYNSSVGLSGSSTPSYSLSGSLPSGLSFDSATGRIFGTPSIAGNFPYSVTAFVNGVPYTTGNCDLSITEVRPANLALACPDQLDLVANQPYASPAIASGGRRPYRYTTEEVPLPTGLSLNPDTGLISGSMNGSLPSTFIGLRVTDGDGQNAFAFCDLTVQTLPALNILTTTIPPAQAGASYSAPISFSGGVSPYTVTESTGLPSGFGLAVVNSNTIQLTGNSSVTGSIAFRLVLRDGAGQVAIRNFNTSVVSQDPLRFESLILNPATVGVPFSSGVSAAGGTPPYRFALVDGTLPEGITFENATFRGTPTTAGSYRATVEVSDAAGGRAAGTFALNVFQGNFRLGCPALSADVGVAYNSAANVLGGSQPYSFSIASGSLPPGLGLDAATGLISGVPTTAGAYIFNFAVSDARLNKTATQCSIGVVSSGLTVLTQGPITNRAGVAYSGSFSAAGGRPPYTWSAVSASPEAGITVATNGGFTGTGTKKGNFSVTVEVRDAAGATARKAVPFVFTDSTLALACPDVTRFTLGATAQGSFGVTGGVSPYRLSVFSGTAPENLVFGQAGAFTVQPLTAGTFTAQYQAIDATDTAVTARCSFEVTGEPLVITTDALPDGRVGESYSAGIASRGGVGRVRYALTGGGLPTGLVFDTTNGSIGGLPEAEGTFGVGVTATDSLGRRAAKSLALTIAPGTLPFRVTGESPLSDAFVGRAYSGGFGAEGGKGPYTFTIGGLPDGLTASGASFGGTPTAAGDATINVTARDATGATAAKSFLLRVKGDGLIITTESLPDGTTGRPYNPGLAREGGQAPFSWSIVSGSVPPGVSFNPANGNFEGTPTLEGQFGLVAEVTDANGQTSRRGYSFEVRPDGVDKLVITSATLPGASAGRSYSTTLGAAGGRTPYRWTINGDLPAGLSLAADGTISGTPQTVGTASFIATVTDALGLKASRTLSITVTATDTPSLSIEGLADTATNNQTLPFTLRVGSALGLPVTGRLTLTFVPDSIHGTDDPNVRFANNTRTLDFTIPANSTTVNLTGTASFGTGTLAGTIRIDSTLSFAGTTVTGPSRTVTIRRAVPTITNLRLTRTGTGLEIRIEGFTNTRALSEARITFSSGADVDLTTGQVTVNVASALQAWFANAASIPFGGQFALTLPFTVSGSANSITGISAVIVNGEGASTAATAN